MNKRVHFGGGYVFVKDAAGISHRIAILSEASAEHAEALIELYGSNRYPEDVATGKASLKGTLKFAHVEPNLLGAVLSGTVASGSQEIQVETGSIPASPGPYTVIVTKAAQFTEDLGAFIAGEEAKQVPTAPAAGEYSVAAGTYTFAAADQAKSYEIAYRSSTTTGKTITVDNKPMGEDDQVFTLVLFNRYKTRRLGLRFPAVSISKWAIAFGNEAHVTQDVDWTAYADPASVTGRVAEVWTG